ncbi:hypothetical protein BCR33DRAFT_784924 [Rhizoclosmatium globosum]|uniref:Zn(2)-C6 fungal-type domain-containing protein n=1 Tax=Rhizoclosmatium globosum TaxID=329046 RepID=A0A1Y2CCV0_9FUNG|nr:hypothetical protein BCR33DRAFT_784924 [Rhizoclosmatium globosum]|eukprot:ORY44869.1 hypothetical protein BCR33DRAFT_784924 [Rhizoclosmatium globosum]
MQSSSSSLIYIRYHACYRCRRQKKRCKPGPESAPACERCVRLGDTSCKYQEIPATAPENLHTARSSHDSSSPGLSIESQKPIHSISVLDHVLTVSDTSLMEQMEFLEWTVEDPDLMPTVFDWQLVHNDLTKNGTALPISFSLDGDSFLRTFFSQPAALRLTRCAMAAYTAIPPLAETVALSYYKRARKAVLQAIDKPTLQNVMAFYFINLFAQWNGQPAIGRPFFRAALDMLLLLQLDVDPDDSPWLFHLNLSDRQKEERRRVFWCCYWFLSVDQATTSDAVQIQLLTNRIQPPRPMEGIFKSFMLETCKTYSFIAEIRRHHLKIPTSIDEILDSESCMTLNSHLIELHQELPVDSLLIAEQAEVLTPTDYDRFIKQLTLIPKENITHVLTLNLNALAGICMVHRLKLYLSMLKSFNPQLLITKTASLVSSAITQSLDAAHRISCLLVFYLDIVEGSARDRLSPEQRIHFTPQLVVSQLNVYPLFEAMIIFWFILCRMDPVWQPLVVINAMAVKDRLIGIVAFVKRVFAVEKNTPGTMTPILTCMEAMMSEIENIYESPGRSSYKVQELELGMRVMALDGEESRECGETQEPCAFLGLLGVEVAGGIRWKGKSEEAWRLFWKLNS